MRPVNKGDSPYTEIHEYAEALPHLIETLGCYCSYCELPITNVPEVEHICAKSRGGSLTDWGNLLLSCKYCNARKGTIIGDNPKTRWIWPDEDNTFLAFQYIEGRPSINFGYLNRCSDEAKSQIESIFHDLSLDNIPVFPKDKDRRFATRNTAFSKAQESYRDWCEEEQGASRERLGRSICRTAISTGFFSVWMEVFKDEPEMKLAFIHGFLGTATNCFDENGNPISRPGGVL